MRMLLSQAVFGLAFFLHASSPCFAGSFTVNPVRAVLSTAHPVAAFTVRNRGDEPAVVQLEALGWTQAKGRDIQVPTDEILATPPIFTLPPGGAQIVRVGLRRAPDPQRELTYRLLITELPGLQPHTAGMRMALRLSVPLFAVPEQGAAPALRWRALRTAEGGVALRVSNAGNAHVQIARIELALPDAGRPLSRDVATYVLPGNQQTWTFEPERPVPSGATLGITARTDAGDFQASLQLEHEHLAIAR